jgi:signal transduction histidine kinase
LWVPINTLLGYQKIILDDLADNPEEERAFLEEAHKSAKHLLSLVNNIMDIARIEANDMPMELGEVKLDEVFKDVEDFRTLAQKKNLNLYVEYPNNHNEIILYSNYAELKRVIANLVDNAIKYTNKGEIKISAEVIENKVSVDNRSFLHMVKIEVADTGFGVPLPLQNNLFKPFVDIYGHYSYGHPHSNNMGIGLALSKSLIKKMGGEISFFSLGKGLGSTVTFTIPMLG